MYSRSSSIWDGIFLITFCCVNLRRTSGYFFRTANVTEITFTFHTKYLNVCTWDFSTLRYLCFFFSFQSYNGPRLCSLKLKLGSPSKQKSHKAIDFFRTTGFKLMVTLQSGGVHEILTLCRIHEIFFQKFHEKAKIHSFNDEKHYIVKSGRFGRQKQFSTKKCSKNSCLGRTRIWIKWLWAAITPVQNLQTSKTATFSESSRRQLSDELSGSPLASILSERRAVTLLRGGGHGKLQKSTFFASFASPRKFCEEKFYQDRTMFNFMPLGVSTPPKYCCEIS